MMNSMTIQASILLVTLFAVLGAGCSKDSATSSEDKRESATESMKTASERAVSTSEPPPLEPLGPVPVQPDNPTTPEKAELGKLLFFDARLGGDASTACSTCHVPSAGWGWPEDISRGYPGTVHWRNSQTLVNSAYYGKLFWAGAALSLEAQAPSAAKGGVAGNGENDLMEARLALIPEYRKRFKAIFGDEWPLIGNAWKAIAAFERTLVQHDTPLDRYLQGDETALTEQQLRGMQVFNGKANCIACHNGPMATDEKYYNIGVPPAYRWEDDGLAQATFRFEYYAKGAPEKLYRSAKGDAGLYFRTKNEWDKGKFRTPSLRYTMFTMPYMHNGAFYTLEEVVDFYNEGGVDMEGRTTVFPQTRSPLIQPLGLTDTEKDDLVAFLEAFSGEEMLMDQPELPEYEPLYTKAELKAAQEAKQ